jgi:hypothetical protein
MTRQSLLSGVLAAPLAVLVGRNASAVETQQYRVVRFGPGTYTFRPGGGMRITAGECRIEGCTFTGTSQAITIE